MTTATYTDGYGSQTVMLVQMTARKQPTFRWVTERGHAVDGLRFGVYSANYQLRHARSHARFSDVTE